MASRPDPTREPKPFSLAKTTPSSSRLCFPFLLPFSSSSRTTLSPPSFPSPSSASFPSTARISGRKPAGDGPALVGQVFSMCDLSGTGLMAVSTHFDIPFLSQRTPEWLKKMFASITRSERKGPVFRFFLDLSDAVSYVKRLNIPSGVVGACRLDLAYEHFKEKPHLFQFVPNEKQVKEANKLLKAMPRHSGCKKVEGVPVFSAQNLDMAIATTDGIKWYTPYFFDKGMLDNILEESVDQHFQSLIQTRHMQRRGDVIDDDFGADVMEEMGDNSWEPPEVQEVMEEMGNPGIPLSVISKAAEIQLLYAVDQMLLGNRWLRKATGIQPKFPYMVDSFEKRSAASILRASTVACLPESEIENLDSNFLECKNEDHSGLGFGQSPQMKQGLQPNVFLPKITMVGVSPGDSGQTNKASLKKTMDDLTEELEQIDRENGNAWSDELRPEERDPLFVANVGDSYAGLAKTGQSRWVRGGDN